MKIERTEGAFSLIFIMIVALFAVDCVPSGKATVDERV